MNFKNFKSILLLGSSLALAFAACTPKPEPTLTEISPLSASLSELEGLIEMKQAGEQDFVIVENGAILNLNGHIQTGVEGKARLDLSTGALIRISPSSLFTLVANENVSDGLGTNLKLEFGRIFIILSGGSLEVDTPSGVAAVRGSYMMVEIAPNTFNILITCLEGNCSASNQAGTVNFTAGEKTTLFAFDPETGQFLPPTVEPMSPEDYQKWLNENPEAAELVNNAIATMTAMAEETAAETSPTEPPPAPDTGASGSAACFSLIEPTSGANFENIGPVTFSWEEQVGAQKYILTFTYPTGLVVSFESTENNITRYIETMPPGGSYTWYVTAIDSDGNEICTAEGNSFTKPAPEPEREKEEEPEPTPLPM